MNVEHSQLNKELHLHVDKLLHQFISCLSFIVKDAMNDSLTNLNDKLAINNVQSDKPNIQSEYITRKEVLEYLRISAPTLYRYQKEGLIQFHRIGRKLYFKKDELVNSSKVLTKEKIKSRKGKNND